uniref:Uncharacterized protein n=1 Tax=Anopheles atroparvus TaxID=41427 RepID=A0AAG5DTT1_ANOAO
LHYSSRLRECIVYRGGVSISLPRGKVCARARAGDALRLRNGVATDVESRVVYVCVVVLPLNPAYVAPPPPNPAHRSTFPVIDSGGEAASFARAIFFFLFSFVRFFADDSKRLVYACCMSCKSEKRHLKSVRGENELDGPAQIVCIDCYFDSAANLNEDAKW